MGALQCPQQDLARVLRDVSIRELDGEGALGGLGGLGGDPGGVDHVGNDLPCLQLLELLSTAVDLHALPLKRQARIE